MKKKLKQTFSTQTIHKHNRSVLATLNITKRVQRHHVSFATWLDEYTGDRVEMDPQKSDDRAGTSHQDDKASQLAELLGVNYLVPHSICP